MENEAEFRCALCGELKKMEEKATTPAKYCKEDWKQYMRLRAKAVRRGNSFTIREYREWRARHGMSVPKYVEQGRALDTPQLRLRVLTCGVCEKPFIGRVLYRICPSCNQDFVAWRSVLDGLTCAVYIAMKQGGELITAKGVERAPLERYQYIINHVTEDHLQAFEESYRA